MIKVVKHGKKEFDGFCRVCGCKFTYEVDDIIKDESVIGVECPDCKHLVIHSGILYTSNRLNENRSKKKKKANDSDIVTFPNEYVFRESLRET